MEDIGPRDLECLQGSYQTVNQYDASIVPEERHLEITALIAKADE